MKQIIRGVLVFMLVLSVTACGAEGKWQKKYDLGCRYLEKGNYEEAIVAYTAAIEIDPSRAEAYVGRGDAYIGKGKTMENLKAAQADYKLAAKRDESINEKYLSLADLYLELGDQLTEKERYEEAVEAFTAAIEIAPDRAEGYLKLADIYIRQEKYAEILPLLEEGLAQVPDHPGLADKTEEVKSGIFMDSSGTVCKAAVYDENGNPVEYRDALFARTEEELDWVLHYGFLRGIEASEKVILLEGQDYHCGLGLRELKNTVIRGRQGTRLIGNNATSKLVINIDQCQGLVLENLAFGEEYERPQLQKPDSVVEIYGSEVSLVNCELFANKTQIGLYVAGSVVEAKDTVVRDCLEIGIYSMDSSVNFQNSTFSGNGNGYGYLIFDGDRNGASSELTFSNCLFKDNQGYLIPEEGTTAVFDNCTFTGNEWDE